MDVLLGDWGPGSPTKLGKRQLGHCAALSAFSTLCQVPFLRLSSRGSCACLLLSGLGPTLAPTCPVQVPALGVLISPRGSSFETLTVQQRIFHFLNFKVSSAPQQFGLPLGLSLLLLPLLRYLLPTPKLGCTLFLPVATTVCSWLCSGKQSWEKYCQPSAGRT